MCKFLPAHVGTGGKTAGLCTPHPHGSAMGLEAGWASPVKVPGIEGALSLSSAGLQSMSWVWVRLSQAPFPQGWMLSPSS